MKLYNLLLYRMNREQQNMKRSEKKVILRKHEYKKKTQWQRVREILAF